MEIKQIKIHSVKVSFTSILFHRKTMIILMNLIRLLSNLKIAEIFKLTMIINMIKIIFNKKVQKIKIC